MLCRSCLLGSCLAPAYHIGSWLGPLPDPTLGNSERVIADLVTGILRTTNADSMELVCMHVWQDAPDKI